MYGQVGKEKPGSYFVAKSASACPKLQAQSKATQLWLLSRTLAYITSEYWWSNRSVSH